MLKRLSMTLLLLGGLGLASAVPSQNAQASSASVEAAQAQAFLDKVFKKLPEGDVTDFEFHAWETPGRDTKEGFGIMPMEGVKAEALIERVMDVDNYTGNIALVVVNKSNPDPRFSPPEAVRFYQRIDLGIPFFSDVHHELVLVDGGIRQGYRYAFWYLLEAETDALGQREDMVRSNYSFGAWLVKDGVVGYALSNAPIKAETSGAEWKTLTTGADALAEQAVKTNIKGMSAWSLKD